MHVVTCGRCGANTEFPSMHGKLFCRSCGRRMRPVREREESGGSAWWVVFLVVGPLVLMLGSVLLCVGFMSSPPTTNATCPVCGHRTYISARSVVEGRDIPCFKCGAILPAQMFGREGP